MSAISPDERKAILTRTRNLKMAQWPHAYVRGNTVQFYESLARLQRRYAILLAIGEGDRRGYCLMDVAAADLAYPATEMPKNHAERVEAGARQLSPYLGHRLKAGQMAERSVFVRELLPQDLKLEVEQ